MKMSRKAIQQQQDRLADGSTPNETPEQQKPSRSKISRVTGNQQ
jgi:hypothetical protein